MKKVNIGLKDEVHSQAKIISILKKIPMSKYMEECIEKAMQEDSKLLSQFSTKNEKKK